MEKTLTAKDTESALLAMQRHIAKNGCYRAGAFEKIWVNMQIHMSLMTDQPGGPPPCPAADMLIAAKISGYQIEPKTQEFFDLRFEIFVVFMMAKLAEATQLAAKELEVPPA